MSTIADVRRTSWNREHDTTAQLHHLLGDLMGNRAIIWCGAIGIVGNIRKLSDDDRVLFVGQHDTTVTLALSEIDIIEAAR